MAYDFSATIALLQARIDELGASLHPDASTEGESVSLDAHRKNLVADLKTLLELQAIQNPPRYRSSAAR